MTNNMKTYTITIAFLLTILMISCQKDHEYSETRYACNLPITDNSASHPKSQIYQGILDQNREKNMAGAVLLVNDRDGLWIGSSGYSDIASGVKMESCNTFLIASISKVFTATAVFKYIEQGAFDLNDPIKDLLPAEIVKNVKNVEDATISDLLSHRSGIPDYYSLQYQTDILNKTFNNWSPSETIKYAYGLKETHNVGETYYYSNTNFLLLGIILERVSGLSLGEIYTNKIFDPLNLESAYFGSNKPIPNDCVKGYADIYGNGDLVESDFLYKDELNTADGGIALNAYDLMVFIEELMHGDLLSPASLKEMTNWFDLPEGWGSDEQTQNGLGIEHFTTSHGNAVGHTGSLYGFSTLMEHFYEEDKGVTYILLVNTATFDYQPQLDIYNQTIEQIFK